MILGPKQLQWIEALESGKYEQGKSFLCRLDTGKEEFCCLGVGCRLFSIEEAKTITWGIRCISFGDECETSGEFSKIIGLFDSIGSCCESNCNYNTVLAFIRSIRSDINIASSFNLSLTNLNDAGFTFNQITQILRKFPELYFYESK